MKLITRVVCRSLLFACIFGSKVLFAQKSSCPAWVPSVEQHNVDQHAGLTIKSPQVAPMRKAAMEIDRMMRINEAFNSIPKARLRTSIFLSNTGTFLKSDKALYSATINVKAYSEKGWDDKCGIIPQADRIAADDATVSFQVNGPGFIYSPYRAETDHITGYLENIQAFAEPKYLGTIGDGIPYYRTGTSGTVFALLSFNNKTPWVPLTVSEFLDAYETTFVNKINELEKERNRKAMNTSTGVSEASVMTHYERLKKTNPKDAEAYLERSKRAREQTAAGKVMETERLKRKDSTLRKELDDFRQHKKSLSSQQLQSQAIFGNGRYSLWDPGTNGPKIPLSKMAPENLYHSNKNSIRHITIWQGGDSQWEQYAKKAWETLDFNLLKSMFK